MNRREMMSAAIAGMALPGMAYANPWLAQSALRRATEPTNRTERYKQYEKLATEKQFRHLGEKLYFQLARLMNEPGGDHDVANLCYTRIHSLREKKRLGSVPMSIGTAPAFTPVVKPESSKPDRPSLLPPVRNVHMMNIGGVISRSLDLQTHEEKNAFSPFKCGCLAIDSAVYGDVFVEIVKLPAIGSMNSFMITETKSAMYSILLANTVFRIETTKGKLIEFQQSHSGPDYQALARCTIDKDDGQGTAVRFHPDMIVHIRPKVHKYAPYGTSSLETGEPVLDLDWLINTRDGINEILQKMRA